MGSTLSLPRRHADKLIAFTAFFVALVSSRFWRLASQVYHRYYSTQEPRDTLHHQRQAILRNSVTALSDLFQFILLSWTWRGPVSRGIYRTLPVIISAIICTIGFATASVLSSWISTTLNDEVLISGGKGCGMVMGIGTDMSSKSIIEPYWAHLISSAENYAQQCYPSESTDTRKLECKLFLKDRLPSSIDQAAPCPFQPKICRSDSSNLHLDTGFLDSAKHFGLNTSPNERILFRSVLHCAPLVTEGYTSTRNATHTNYTRYHYGSSRYSPSELAPNDMTYEYPSRNSQYNGTSLEDWGLYDALSSYGRSFTFA